MDCSPRWFAGEGAILEGVEVLGGELLGGAEVVEGLTEEARRATGPVVDAFANLGSDHLDHGADEGPGRVVFAAVAPGVAHVLNLGFVEVGKLVFFLLRAETEFVDVVDDLPEVIAALNLVLQLAENLPNLVFEGVRAAGLGLKAMEIGEEFLIDEVPEIIPREGRVVVEGADLGLRGRPGLPLCKTCVYGVSRLPQRPSKHAAEG